ncbi:hypothetical protein F2Q69_00055036 [Brassica cretica]|uniref:LIM zinc-binding domain-containing protein n=1 Tax=Brassica cretica TaxID=69181 RepID=A0A8S9N4C7_BRACR|nr:hypothetical protein F2Q69_00055036 [Brassica cretica]
MWCLSCLKPSTSEDPFEAEIDLALAVSREEADIQEAKQLASALQESSRLQKEHEDEQKKRTTELEKDAQIARAFQYDERDNNSALEDEKHEQPAKIAVESFQDKGKIKQFEEQVKNDEQVAQDLQNRFNKMAYEESPGLYHNAVLDDKDEHLAKTAKSSKEKRKSKQFEEQVKSDEQVAQDLQNLLSEMPYKESARLHDNSVLGNEDEQFPKTVGRSLKVKGKEKILEDEQVKKDEELAARVHERLNMHVNKDEELALVLQESLNMVEPPPRPRIEEHKSIPRRAALDREEQLAKERSKEKGKGKQIEDEQVKKDEQLAVIVQESLNMVEPPEEKSNISSSRAPMDEDEQRIIWESLKGKGLITQSEDEVEDVGKLVEANPPPPRCGGCYYEIEHERSVDVLGVLWHPKCLICGACHNPIAIHEVETHVSNLRGKFHKNCYRRYCYVCQEKVKIRMFNEHPFWKERYCPDHDSDGTHKCFSCERLEPRETNFVELDDGRRLCLECMDSAVMDTYEVQPLHFEIREFFEGLNMKIEREFPFLLVEKQALNKAEEEEKIDNQDGVVTRGICLSEEQIVTSVSKGPKLGPNKQLIGKTTESQKVVSGCPVTAILILYGLPRLLTGYILAHEMMHAYLRLNGCRNLNTVMEEGICQVLGHMWLETQTYATIDAAASSSSAAAAAESSSSSSRTPSEANVGKKGEWSEFEKKLVEFCKNQIETDESAAYGDGFRKVDHMVTNSSLKDTLKEILRRG